MSTKAPLNSPKSKRRPLTVWELPKLLTSVHHYRKSATSAVCPRPHYTAILAYIHRNRFVVASQVQRRFSTYLKSDRTTRRHLAEMESMGDLSVVETNNTSPLWPKVYFVTRRGLTRLKNALQEKGQQWTESLKDRRQSEGTAAQHVLHELFITEFLLIVWDATQTCKEIEILTMQRRSLARHDAFKVIVGGRRTRLQPDAMFLYRQQGRGMMCCFVEVDNGTMNLKQLIAKFQRYQNWAESASASAFLKAQYERHGAKQPTATFRILILVGCRDERGSQRRLDQILQLLSRLSPAVRNRFWLATVQKINGTINTAEILDRTFWRLCN